MKVSTKLEKLFELANVKTVGGLVSQAKKSEQILSAILEQYRKQLCWCGYVYLFVRTREKPYFFSADNPHWISEGFSELDENERQLIEFLLEKHDCPMAVTESGLMCSLPIRRIRPVASAVAA